MLAQKDAPAVVRTKHVAPVLGEYFSPVELATISLAAHDGRESLHRQGRVTAFLRWMVRPTVRLELANPQLEALRRVAIMLKAGRPADAVTIEIAAARSAGFSQAQLEALAAQAPDRAQLRHGGPAAELKFLEHSA